MIGKEILSYVMMYVLDIWVETELAVSWGDVGGLRRPESRFYLSVNSYRRYVGRGAGRRSKCFPDIQEVLDNLLVGTSNEPL